MDSNLIIEDRQDSTGAIIIKDGYDKAAFGRALAALQAHRPCGLGTQGRMDAWLTVHCGAAEAAAYRAYKDIEDTMY